jgi:hypothetical protein
MLRKVALDSLRADLAAIDDLLRERSADQDPIGHFQFSERKRDIEREIAALEETPERTAAVGLYFGGEPVIGSRGIRADFAGQAMGHFQDMIAKRFAAVEAGMLGRRGPPALRTRTDLMLTQMARGSIGLLLEEVEEQGSLVDSKLRPIVDEITQMVTKVAAPDETDLEEVLESLDQRLLTSLREFFHLLDEAGATLRLVEAEVDETLDRAAVRRGRTRTAMIDIDDEETDDIVGTLYLLPQHRRFELLRRDTGEMIYGVVSAEYSSEHLSDLRDLGDVLGKVWRTRMRVREVRRPGQASRRLYTLLGLVARVEPS